MSPPSRQARFQGRHRRYDGCRRSRPRSAAMCWCEDERIAAIAHGYPHGWRGGHRRRRQHRPCPAWWTPTTTRGWASMRRMMPERRRPVRLHRRGGGDAGRALLARSDMYLSTKLTAAASLDAGITTIIDACHYARAARAHSDAALDALDDQPVSAPCTWSAPPWTSKASSAHLPRRPGTPGAPVEHRWQPGARRPLRAAQPGLVERGARARICAS